MFSKAVLVKLLESNRSFFSDLVEVKSILDGRFVGLSDQIRCLLLAVASGESMLLLGPPGTAKSRLIRAFANLAGLIGKAELVLEERDKKKPLEQRDKYFEYLLTPFTEPSELFGYFDIAKLMSGKAEAGTKLERIDEGMMQFAEVVFLDEVFNASSAILNSLLTFVNERKFHDRGRSYEVSLSCLFGATNFPPKRPELLAIYDRFLLHCWVDNALAEPADLGGLLRAGWKETNAADVPKQFPALIDNAEQFRKSLHDASVAGELAIDPQDDTVNLIVTRLADITAQARRRNLSALSNRRLVRFSKIFLVNALLRAAEENRNDPEISAREDLMLVVRFGMDRMVDGTQASEFEGLLVGATRP
jgi:MoxR-like ATPase